MKFSKLNRDIHRWSSIIVAVPIVVIATTGVILQWKKEVGWIQPPSQESSDVSLSIGFDQLLGIATTISEAEIRSWDDVDRLDVRPSKGIVKVRSKNRWEIQIDTNSGEVLQVAFRRSDLIESIHDGSFFHDQVKLWIFFPIGLVLLVLWATGLYLFFLPYYAKWKRKRRAGPTSRPTVTDS